MPGADSAPDGGFSTMMLMMMGWMVVATALYLLRPRSLRQRGDMKPERNNVSYQMSLHVFINQKVSSFFESIINHVVKS